MTIKEALNWALPKLPQPSPRLDAEVLLSFIIKKNRAFLLAYPEKKLITSQIQKYKKLVIKRAQNQPIAYLTKQQAFYDLNFFVNKHVLIPRPETELIIDEIKKNKDTEKKQATIIDLGTGSGCIIITLAVHKQGKQYFAVDISAPALKIAKINAKQYKQNKIKFYQGNLLKPIIKQLKANKIKIANPEIIITANLPYLEQNLNKLFKNPHSASLKYEPQLALRAGKDGLKYYRLLAHQLKEFAKIIPNKKIILYCEIAPNQRTGIKQIFNSAQKITFKKDLANLSRLAIIQQ